MKKTYVLRLWALQAEEAVIAESPEEALEKSTVGFMADAVSEDDGFRLEITEMDLTGGGNHVILDEEDVEEKEG